MNGDLNVDIAKLVIVPVYLTRLSAQLSTVGLILDLTASVYLRVMSGLIAQLKVRLITFPNYHIVRF